MCALDAEIAARRQRQTEAASAQDQDADAAAAPAPWPDTVDGATFLAELPAYYARYVVLPEGAADAAALCTVHTYAVDAAQITPRFAVVSPQPHCGKTTLMALLGAAAARPIPASNITAAAVYRVIDERRPTLLIDEADTFLRDNEDWRGVLNAGHYRPQAFVVRCVPEGDTWVTRDFSCWAPLAIALIGSLATTLADRSITIKLRRKTKHEQVERLRLDRLGNMAEPLRRRWLRWAQDHLAQLRDCDPAMPGFLHDRAADNWRPLCAIAEVAGGDWPERTAHAIRALTPQELDTEAIAVLLLEDIWRLFDEGGTDRLTSADVVAALHKLEGRPWSEWGQKEKPITARSVARLLSPFGIKSKNIRRGTETPKGYEREDFVDAWTRYLPLLSATTPQASNGVGLQLFSSATASNHAPVADTRGQIMAFSADCGGVADRGAKNGDGDTNKDIQAGDWCYLLSGDGVQQNLEPYLCKSVQQGPNGRWYALFLAIPNGWPIEQCERAPDPPPPFDGEVSNGQTHEEPGPQCGETQTPDAEALPDGSTNFRCARCGSVVITVPF